MADQYISQEEKEFSRRYKFSLWWVEHRSQLKKLLLILFAIFDGVLLTFVLWTMLDTFVVSYPNEQAAIEQIATSGQEEFYQYTQSNKAQSLSFGRTLTLPGGEGEYDFYTPVTNPNDDWYATVRYRYAFTDGDTDERTAVILPLEEEKPLIFFGQPSASQPRNASLDILDIEWQRIDHHFTGDYPSFLRDRFDIRIFNAQYDPSFAIDEKPVGRVSFTVQNNGAFSFFEPQFIVLLKRGQSVVGVNSTSLVNLESGKSQAIQLNWFGTPPQANQVEIIPNINILDPNVYKELEAEIRPDTRSLSQ